MQNEPEFYTVASLAERFLVPKRTVEKWILKKRLPVIRCGRLIRIPRLEVEKRLLSGNLLR
jgi:excisionase family DNA binding protein